MSDRATLPTCEIHDGIAMVTLDDGKANAFSTASLEVLERILDQVETDEARALVIAGRPGRFSAGFDLGEMTAGVDEMRSLVARGAHWWLRLYQLAIPTVAACTGHALAGGAITLLACDVRFGADAPAKIGLNEVAIGMPLPVFAVEFARDRLVAPAFTAATMGATVYDPATAALVGYLDRVVPADTLLAEATAEARRLGELRTGAYARTKRAARGAMVTACLESLDTDLAGLDAPAG
ncbi:crotonase/enoyl-CoA hydratase family protein [soil metagenome]